MEGMREERRGKKKKRPEKRGVIKEKNKGEKRKRTMHRNSRRE